VLARLDRIKGVERSLANRAGILVRVSLAKTANPDQVAEKALGALAEEQAEPVRLAGDDLERALDREEWLEADELSAIEFRTLVVRNVRAFAKAEGLDEETGAKLVKIAEEVWDRQARTAATQRNRPGGMDWRALCSTFASAFIDRAKDLLAPPQVERLEQARDHLLGGAPPRDKGR
jgi:hypothetical protein